MAMNYKQLMKTIRDMKHGERININAINLSERAIESLRHAIELGNLYPDPEELRKVVAADSIAMFESGECIAPQMTYIRFKL